MASEEAQNKKGTGTGFAGLSSMVSNVDATVTRAEKKSPGPSLDDAPAQRARPAPQTQAATKPEPSRERYQQAAKPSGNSSAGKWLIGPSAVIGLIGLIWFLSESGNESTPPRAQPPAHTAPAPAWPQQAPAHPQAPDRPTEERPPAGTNLVHGPAQLRYCLAEHIRVGAAQGALNNHAAPDVRRFNAVVVDYNSRCGKFRYPRGSLEKAKSDVERFRQILESEGRARFTQAPQQTFYSTSQAPVYQTTPSPSGPESAVREIQQRLNKLGYDAGSPDGLEGPKTRSAITGFQKDYGMSSDGVASTELLAVLMRLPTCRYNAVMSEAEYRNCGISSPQVK